MTQQLLNLDVPDSQLGDNLRAGGTKINAMFTELYSLSSQTISAGAPVYGFTATPPTATREQAITAAIADALTRGFTRVYVPASMIPYNAASVTFVNTIQMVREGGNFSSWDVQAYGAAGDGVQEDAPAFRAAQAGAGADVLVPACAVRYRIASNLAMTQPLTMLPGAILKPTLGTLVTFASFIAAGPWQIFDLSVAGSGAIFFLGGAHSAELQSDWWGAIDDGVADDTAVTQNAVQASVDNVMPTRFGGGVREIIAPIVATTAQFLSLLGTGWSYLRWGGAVSSSVLKITGSMQRVFLDGLWFLINDATVTALELNNPNDISFGGRLSNMTFQGPNAQGVLVNSEVDEFLWDNVYFRSCGKGVYFKKSSTIIPSSNHTFLACYFQDSADWGVDSERSALMTFIGNAHQANGAKAVRLNRHTALVYLGNYHELHPSGSVGLSINNTAGDGFPGGAQIVGGNVFDINNGGTSVGLELGTVGKGVVVLPNQFFSAKTGIRILSTADPEITIFPQNFSGVTTPIDDQRTDPSRAFMFNIGTKVITSGKDPFVVEIANGGLQRQVFKVRIPKEAWRAAATSQEIRLGTTDVRTRIVGCFCDTTVALAGLAGTIQLQIGSASTLSDIILLHDVKTAAVTKGLADADLGALLARATAVQGGGGSWTGGNDIYAKLFSSVGNVGTGAVTNLTAGTIYVYVVTDVMP